MAESVSVPEKLLALKPKSISFEEAAAVPMAGLTVLRRLRDVGKIQPGPKVLIQGAAGGVGTYAVQIAKSYGAVLETRSRPARSELTMSLSTREKISHTMDTSTTSARPLMVITHRQITRAPWPLMESM